MKSEDQTYSKRLYRSEKDRIIGGVAGGIAEYFKIDSTIIRILFILLAVTGGSGILIYLILWVIVPTETSVNKMANEETIRENASEVKRSAEKTVKKIRDNIDPERSRMILGSLLLVIGIMLLANNFISGFFAILVRFWPVFFIAGGIAILAGGMGEDQ